MSSDNTLSINHSSAIESANYNPKTKDLLIDFGKSQYTFAQVEPEVIESLIEADSAGSYYHANIKGKYSSVREVSI